MKCSNSTHLTLVNTGNFLKKISIGTLTNVVPRRFVENRGVYLKVLR